MRESQLAEVLSRPLDQIYVTVVALGLDSLVFDWIEKPDMEALRQAGEGLKFLSAIDAGGGLTDLGTLIADLQVDPALARLVYLGCQQGMGEAAAALGGLLSTASNIFFRGRDPKAQEDARAKHAALRNRVHGDPVTLYRLNEAYQAVLFSSERPGGDARGREQDGAVGGDNNGGDPVDAADNVGDVDDGLLRRLVQLRDERGDRDGHEEDRDAGGDAMADDDDAVSFADDTASVASGDSDMLSVAFSGSQDSVASIKSLDEAMFLEAKAEEEAERVAARRVANSRAAKRWCVENYVNGKALGIAGATTKDLIRASRRLKIFAGDQARKPTDAEVVLLFAGAYFLNVALRVGEAGPARGAQYHLLGSDRASWGFFHPSSSL